MKNFTMLLYTFFCTVVLWGQERPQWMRYVSISPTGEYIAFTYKGDLYKVPSQGGQAIQLTFHQAHDYMPIWSKDGKQLAFASDRYGNFDVYVMDASGGEAKRLTFHSNDEYPYTFSSDGNSIWFGGVRQDVAEHRQYPTGSQPEVYTVPVQGGRVKQLWTLPAEALQVNSTGSTILYHDKKGGENEWRKHHQSSITRDIWSYDVATGTHKMITSFYGEDRNPVFAPGGNSIYYLSETSGNFNIHKMNVSGGDSKQLTQFKLHPVRFLTIADNGLMSFSYDGEVYTFREGQQPNKVNVQLFTQASQNQDAVVTVNGGISEMALSPDGKEVAVIARGEVFVTSIDGAITKRVTQTPATERFLNFSPDGNSLIYAREENGKWSIFKSERIRSEEPFFFASTLLKEEPLILNENENYHPVVSPDGKKVAYIENRRTLKVLTLATKEAVTLLTPKELFHMYDGDQFFTWSPDSKWLLASFKPTMANGEIVLLDASAKKPMENLTQSGYDDYSPKWVNGGKQLLWFSNRDGMKSFATSGGSQSDVYTLFLTQEGWDRFRLSKDDFNLLKELEKVNKKEAIKEEDKKKSGSKKEDIQINELKFDWEDLRDRKARLTIHSSQLGDAVLSDDGEKLYYLARFEKGMNLWSTDLRTKETKMELALNTSFGRLAWDKEHKSLFLLSGGSISKINPQGFKKEVVKIAGEMTQDVMAERTYMFEHVWLRTKGIFYTPDMHGVDWDLLKKEYAKYVPHIGNSYEFAEMLSEMLGELNVSHAGARYNNRMSGGDETASLGIFIDYSYDGDGIKIAEVIKGGPLDKAHLDIASGMIIEKIDGEKVTTTKDVAQYLNRKADKFTLLEVKSVSGKDTKQVTVKPISLREENALLYRRWVKINQDEVERMSNGQLGYVHIPGMGDGPYRNTYEEMMGKYHNRKGMIIDTRFNGGGDLVADLAMFFTGEKFLEYATADRAVGYEPTFRWTKPTLAMFNEA